ncbi:helix-hairpin-helix domain-containing protein [Aeromonas caviae]
MNQSLHSELFRVTSIPYSSSSYVIFSGIPLNDETSQIKDGKYYVTIKARPDTLPAQPSQGQQWTVHGKPLIERVEIGDVVMQQHTYESPEHVICTLPETGEQLIQFIAKEPDFKGIGLGKARALWQLLGEQFHATLRTDTPESRERLKGILSDVSIDALFNGYAKYKNLNHCNWMAECRIPSPIQQRILKFHGESSVDAIKANPYLLVGFGMGFEDVDALSQTKFEVELKDPTRLSAALEFTIHAEVEKGHTYTTQARLRPLLTKLLGDGELAAQAFKAGYHQAQYVLNRRCFPNQPSSHNCPSPK